MKNVVIMGASSGIGKQMAVLLASRGVRVGLAARSYDRLEEIRALYPENVEIEEIDISSADAPERLSALAGRLGGMDIYVHVAGIGVESAGLDPEAEARTADINAAGFARMVSAAYRYFKARGKGGQIAAVTSVAGTNGIGRMPAYSASKCFDQRYLTALDQLSRAEKAGVCFTDIRPGWTRTPLLNPDASYPLELDADDVARQALKAIIRKERIKVIDWRWNLIVALWRLVPDILWVRLPLGLGSPEKPFPGE